MNHTDELFQSCFLFLLFSGDLFLFGSAFDLLQTMWKKKIMFLDSVFDI